MAPFKYQARTREFNEAYTKQVAADVARARETMISPRNMQRFDHGRKWTTKPVDHGDEAGEMTKHSLVVESPFDDIVNHDLLKFLATRRRMVNGMLEQLTASFYQTISQSTEKSGNTVLAPADQSPAESFLAAIEKVEFGIDENGNVSLPQVHMGREAYEKTMASLDAQGPEFKERLERVKAEKSLRARQREEERLARFPSAWAEDSI